MAAVDSLLRLMMVRSADTLVVASGAVPSLRRAGQVSQLSMPALQAGLVSAFADEILAAAGLAENDLGDSFDTAYQSEDGDYFAVTVERRGAELRLTFRPGKAPASVASAAPSPPQATPASETPAARPLDSSQTAPPGLAPGPQSASPEPAPEAVGEPASWHPTPADEGLRATLLALFERAVYEGASDIVLSTGEQPRMRIAGTFVPLDELLCTDQHIRATVGPALRVAHLRELHGHGSIDLSLEPRPGLRFRVNVFQQYNGLAAALRPIRTDVPRLEQLNLPEHLYQLVDYPHGLVLVCGPAGSGKSTTLAALLEHINRTRAQHVVTLEDPVEYRYTSKRALIHQREIGVHVDSFESGLRAALRESPDIISVGEMRELTTISAALTAAETGHLVLSTIHSSNATMAIERIVDVFPEHQQRQVRTQLSGALRAVLTQRLLPGARGGTRVPVYEKMVVTSAIANQIRDNKAHQIASQILTGRAEGMVPFERTLAEAVVAGRITLECARSVTTEKQQLNEMIVSVRTSW